MNQPIPPPPPYPYPQPSRPPRRRRVWPWIAGGVLVVVLAVVMGAGVMVMLANTSSSETSPSSTPTHTYPKDYPKEKLPAQIDGYKRDPSDPSIYQILRPSKANPNVVDVNNSDRIGADDMGIPFGEGGAKGYARHKETDELEPGVYCDREEPVTNCYAASNSGRIWNTSDLFESLTREQLARWTTHFIAAVKE